MSFIRLITKLHGLLENLNGRFQITINSADSTTILGINTQQTNEVAIGVTGLTDRDISGTIMCLGGIDPTDGSACTLTTIN